jgi:Zn ribbon nucleic-acid-binding protein
MSAVQDLAERSVTFDCRYNMKCPDCPEATALTSAEYHREDNEAHVKCQHCGADIHFGPAVMTLRDIDDPIIDDHRVCTFAWYHMSTDPVWPSATHLMPQAASESLEAMMPPAAVRDARYRYENKALHLGTYEAAIESMLRHMGDENDGDSQFYLYRVAMHCAGVTLEPGWRDENSAKAAQITEVDLGDADGIRYLNVHESPGSLSLAVRRRAIAGVQCVSLPLDALHIVVAPTLLAEVARIRSEIETIEASRSADLSPLDRLRFNSVSRSGRPFARSSTPEQTALWDRIRQILKDEYLPGVSDPVRDRFAHALGRWRRAQVPAVDYAKYVDRFASMAATLTRSSEVIRLLGARPVREL